MYKILVYLFSFFYSTLLFSQNNLSSDLTKIWADAPNQFKNWSGELVESTDQVNRYKVKNEYKFAQVQVVFNKAHGVASFLLEWNYNETTKVYVQEEVQKAAKEFQKIAKEANLQVMTYGKEDNFSFTAIDNKEKLPVFTIVRQDELMLLLISDVLYSKNNIQLNKNEISSSTNNLLISNFNSILNDATVSFEKIRTTINSPRAYDTTIYNVNQGLFNDEKGHIVRYEANYSFILKENFQDEYYYVDYIPIGSDKELQFKNILLPHLQQLAKTNNWKIKKYAQDKRFKDQINGVVFYDINKEKVVEYFENSRTKNLSFKICSKINPKRDFTYKGAIILFQKNIGGKEIANARIYHITDVEEPDYENLKTKLIQRWQNPELIVQFEFRKNATQQSVMYPFIGSKLNVVEYDINAQGFDR